jgi:oligopeptide/dipeptide ABC transporter ATP-binding protein
MKIQE